jgi:hypothetical protein
MFFDGLIFQRETFSGFSGTAPFYIFLILELVGKDAHSNQDGDAFGIEILFAPKNRISGVTSIRHYLVRLAGCAEMGGTLPKSGISPSGMVG